MDEPKQCWFLIKFGCLESSSPVGIATSCKLRAVRNFVITLYSLPGVVVPEAPEIPVANILSSHEHIQCIIAN